MKHLLSVLLVCASVAGAQEMTLRNDDNSRTTVTGDGIRTVLTYKIIVGNTDAADRSLRARLFSGMSGYDDMNATMYLPNPDGSWKVESHGRPPDRRLDDPRGFAEREAHIAYLSRRDVIAFLRAPHRYANFGEKGDPYYKRARVPQSELPAPFDRMSRGALAPASNIVQFNDGGGIKVYLHDPYDEDEYARAVLERMKAEAAGAVPQREARGTDVCRLARIERDDCVYSCRSGREHRIPVRTEAESGPGGGPVVACAQVVFPF